MGEVLWGRRPPSRPRAAAWTRYCWCKSSRISFTIAGSDDGCRANCARDGAESLFAASFWNVNNTTHTGVPFSGRNGSALPPIVTDLEDRGTPSGHRRGPPCRGDRIRYAGAASSSGGSLGVGGRVRRLPDRSATRARRGAFELGRISSNPIARAILSSSRWSINSSVRRVNRRADQVLPACSCETAAGPRARRHHPDRRS